MKKLSAKLRSLHNLPDDWQVFCVERLPRDAEAYTEVRVYGCVFTANRIWTGKEKRDFVLSKEQYWEMVR